MNTDTDFLTLEAYKTMIPFKRVTTKAIERLSPEDRAQLEKERADAERAKEEQHLLEANLERPGAILRALEQVPPGLLNGFDIKRHPSPENHKAVMAWKPGKIGLRLTGPTGKGKSRTMAQLIRRLMADSIQPEDYRNRNSQYGLTRGISYVWASCPSLGGKFSLLSYEDQAAFARLVEELETTQVLILDDLGAQKPTVTVSDTFHRIIDYRYANELPLILSSNCGENELKTRLMDEHGRTIRRLLEMTTKVAF